MEHGGFIISRLHRTAKLELSRHVQPVQTVCQYHDHRFSGREWICPDWQSHIWWLDFDATRSSSQPIKGNWTCTAAVLPLWARGSDQPLPPAVRSQHEPSKLATHHPARDRFVCHSTSYLLLMLETQLVVGPSTHKSTTASHPAPPSPQLPPIPTSPQASKAGSKSCHFPTKALKSILGGEQ